MCSILVEIPKESQLDFTSATQDLHETSNDEVEITVENVAEQCNSSSPNGDASISPATSEHDSEETRLYSRFSSISTIPNDSKADQKDDAIQEGSGTNFSANEEEADKLSHTNYFDFLDDYIRFDVSRTGVSCFSGYSISVQYEDDYLVGKAGTLWCNFLCNAKSRVRLRHYWGKSFELVYLPRVSCIRPKNCVYKVRIPGEENEIGSIHFQQNIVHIYNASEKCLSLRRKQGTNSYSIKTEAGERLASVEIFRGFRGDIMYYGLSILGDASSTDKALLIGLTIAMDIRQRESEMRCSFIWIPLFCVLVIGLFAMLPWLYFYERK
ncbi:hypothetical protein Ocin01_10676 [Orchesella cincta]|uniref:Uncharacterized protein n=1 Tax=Orchesella cincta TaxID=48709 RepID=A0A1D2MSY6_ORCCI|nr:hypothetical protein Ocin01_10676 [Orchesella cincta]